MRKMKDSGIDWIGKIPDNWQIKKIENCFEERNEKVSDYEWEPLSVTKQGIVKQLENAAKSDAHDSRKKVCKGDFVINSRSDRKQSSGLSEYNGSVSLINIVLKNKNLENEYVKYLLKNYAFAEEFYRWGNGIVADLWSTNYQRMRKISIPVPPIEEQKEIAKIIDYETNKIDIIIEKTKETIEDYKKYKQSIITEAITRGIKKNVEMKDTNIEYIGKVPINWKKIKIKYLTQIGPKCITNIKNDIYVTYTPMEYIKNGYYIPNEGLWGKNNSSYNTYMEDDIVMAKLTPCFENGNIAIMENLKNNIGYGSSELIVFRVYENMVLNKYMLYILQSEIFKKLCISTMTGTGGLKRVSVDFVKNYICFIPEITIQKEIVNYLDKKISEINLLIKNKENIIVELERYKTSIIYEYVTGKKEVI